MKFTKPILITTITLLSLLLGFVVVGQNTKPVTQKELQPAQVAPVTKIDTEKIELQKLRELQRKEIMKNIPDDQLILVSEWGNGYIDGYDLSGKFYHINEPNNVLTEEKARELFRASSPLGDEGGYSPNGYYLYEGSSVEDDGSGSYSVLWGIDRVHGTGWGSVEKTTDLMNKLFARKSIKGWYIKPQYIKEKIPEEILHGDFSFFMMGDLYFDYRRITL